jgi:hypothetical protein
MIGPNYYLGISHWWQRFYWKRYLKGVIFAYGFPSHVVALGLFHYFNKIWHTGCKMLLARLGLASQLSNNFSTFNG